jgi:YegS/Rv2252/BmrU family lipid kinase
MLLILYNSNSGNGKGESIAQVVSESLDAKGISYHSYKDHEWPEITEFYDAVWLIGGDGTLNYYLNKYPNAKLSIGLYPGGTGNDFYSNLQSHNNIVQLVDQYLDTTTRTIDVGMCNSQRFINTIGIGFDGEVLKDMSLARWVGGHLGYLLVVIKHLFFFKELTFRYNRNDQFITERLLLFFVSNAPTTGGGFIISPKAKIDDGTLQIVIAKPTPILKRLFLLPKVERGNHLSHPLVNNWTAKSIHIIMDKPTFYQIDGELKSSIEFDIKLHESDCSFLS